MKKSDYMDFTTEEIQAFSKLFSFDGKDFLYLSKNQINKINNSSAEAEIVISYIKRHKINIKTSYVLIRVIIFEALKRIYKELKLKNYLIFDPRKITVYNIEKVTGYLNDINNLLKLEDIHKNREESLFRGQASFGWKLLPSIYREDKWIENEDLMIKEMIRRFPDFLNDDKRIEILTKLQHYGLPTRLLDLTENPLVALFFACDDKNSEDEDGRIYYFSPPERDIKYTGSDLVTILSNISKMDGSFGTESLTDEKILNRFLWFLQEEKTNFKELFETNSITKYCYVKTNLNNERIKSQTGSFIITGVGKTKSDVKEICDKFEEKKILFIVDRKRKKDIMDQLKLLGIYEGSIYPDLTKNAEFIKNKYKENK